MFPYRIDRREPTKKTDFRRKGLSAPHDKEVFMLHDFHRAFERKINPASWDEQNAPMHALTSKNRPKGLQFSVDEDLYCLPDVRAHGTNDAEPVLLLKKGASMALSDLPKLLRNGVNIRQVSLQVHNPETGESKPLPKDIPPQALADLARFQQFDMSPPGESQSVPAAPSSLQKPESARFRRVMVVESDQKQLKRIMDCLFLCGFHPGQIHPVRMTRSLDWAVAKHQPDVLLVNYHLSPNATGMAMLAAIRKQLPPHAQIVVTLPIPSGRNPDENKLIQTLCADWNIQIVYRPMNRFALKKVMGSPKISPNPVSR